MFTDWHLTPLMSRSGGNRRSCWVTASSHCSLNGWCCTAASSAWRPTTFSSRSVLCLRSLSRTWTDHNKQTHILLCIQLHANICTCASDSQNYCICALDANLCQIFLLVLKFNEKPTTINFIVDHLQQLDLTIIQQHTTQRWNVYTAVCVCLHCGLFLCYCKAPCRYLRLESPSLSRGRSSQSRSALKWSINSIRTPTPLWRFSTHVSASSAPHYCPKSSPCSVPSAYLLLHTAPEHSPHGRVRSLYTVKQMKDINPAARGYFPTRGT